MNFLLRAVFAACALLSIIPCDVAIDWCYHLPTCNDVTWSTIVPQQCSGTRQSPININSSAAKPDPNLNEFSFQNFDSISVLRNIKNTGKTVKVDFASGVKIAGGGLSESYDGLQFHLHWGNGSFTRGSEHTVDGKSYPLELHIVNIKSSYNGNTTLALADPTGLAGLGFLIEPMAGDATGQPASWKTLTSYLTQIKYEDDSVLMQPGISLNDLVEGVNLTRYYRYLGSLTTPNCNEAVVWTVFKDTVKVSKDLIDLFSTTVHIFNTGSPFMIYTHRNTQPPQEVTTQQQQQPALSNADSVFCSLWVMALSLILGRYL